jgi:hypothetical protein
MENKPYYTSESDSDNSSSKDSKKSSDFSFSGYRAPEHTPSPRPERRVAAAPAIEGIISWRDERREDELRHSDKEGNTSKAEADDDSEEDTSKSKKSTKTQPLPPIQHAPVHSIVEAQVVPAAEGQEEGSEEDEEKADTTQPAATRLPFAFPQAAEFRSQVTAEASEDDDAVNHADDAHMPRAATTPRAFTPPAPLPPVAAPRSFEAGVPVQQEAATEHASEDDQSYFTPAPTMGPVQGPAPALANVYPSPAQSHEDDDTDPYAQPVTAGGGGQPPVPPVTQHALYNQPPDPNYAYANQYMHPGGPMANQYNMAPSNANMAPAAPVMPIEHPHRHGEPLAAAVGIGLIAEHFGRKRADKKLEKRVNERTDKLFDKQGDQYAANQRQLESQQRTFTNEQQHQASEMQRMQQTQAQAQERFAAVAPTVETYASQPSVESAPNAGPGYAPVAGEAFRPQPGHPNQQPGRFTEAARPQPAPNQEQMPQDAAELQGVQLNAHEHVKSSNWHNIVVDDQGREVVGAINYGEGFRGEQRHNLMPTIKDDSQSDTNGQQYHAGSAGSQGGSFGMGGGGVSGPMYPGALPSGMTNPTLPQGQPTHVDPQHQLEASNQPTTNMTNPWFWIMLLLIIAAFFTAALV